MQLNLDKIPEWFLRTPAGKQIIEEEVLRILEQRRALAQEIAQLRLEEAKEIKRAAEKFAKARAAYEECRTKARAAESAYGQALQEKLGVSNRFAGEIGRRESALRESASPQIDTFLQEITRNEEAIRRGLESTVIETKTFVSGRKENVYSTNRPTSDAALSACRQARADAETLKFEPLTEAEVLARLSQISAAIPAVSQEVVGRAA